MNNLSSVIVQSEPLYDRGKLTPGLKWDRNGKAQESTTSVISAKETLAADDIQFL